MLDALRQNLETHRQVLEADGNDPRLQTLANEFHNILVARGTNRALVLLDAMLDSVIALTSRSLVESQSTSAGRLRLNKRSLKSHQNLYRLIEEGDAESANELWQHLTEVTDYYMTAVPQSGLVVDLMSGGPASGLSRDH